MSKLLEPEILLRTMFSFYMNVSNFDASAIGSQHLQRTRRQLQDSLLLILFQSHDIGQMFSQNNIIQHLSQ